MKKFFIWVAIVIWSLICFKLGQTQVDKNLIKENNNLKQRLKSLTECVKILNK